MNEVTIEIVASATDGRDLDDLLWHVLWEPLGFPRNIRQTFSVPGESLELVAKANSRIVGGLVAVWSSEHAVELRHIAVRSDAQNQGVGQHLVAALVTVLALRGCCRIHTIARNTSIDFFRGCGFRTALGTPPEHPVFKKQGISFELMEKMIEPDVTANESQPIYERTNCT